MVGVAHRSTRDGARVVASVMMPSSASTSKGELLPFRELLGAGEQVAGGGGLEDRPLHEALRLRVVAHAPVVGNSGAPDERELGMLALQRVNDLRPGETLVALQLAARRA